MDYLIVFTAAAMVALYTLIIRKCFKNSYSTLRQIAFGTSNRIMVTIIFGQSEQLLTIRYGGHVDPNETNRCAEETRKALLRAQPGFRLLVDMTELQAMERSCAPDIRNIMKMCNQKGIAEVVRIIPDPKHDIGLQIMSAFHYRGDVHIATCASATEAMASLSK